MWKRVVLFLQCHKSPYYKYLNDDVNNADMSMIGIYYILICLTKLVVQLLLHVTLTKQRLLLLS